MFYAYVLISLKDLSLYIGFTGDLKKRLKEHNNGLTESIKNKRPLKLVYYEAHLRKEIAIEREKYLKSGWGRKYLKEKLRIGR